MDVGASIKPKRATDTDNLLQTQESDPTESVSRTGVSWIIINYKGKILCKMSL